MARTQRTPPGAILLILTSALSFAFMGVAVKGAGNLPVFQKVLFRNLVILFVISPVLLGKGPSAFFGHRGTRRYLLGRSVLGFAGVMCYFTSLSWLTLADATMLNKLSPFFVTLFAALLLGERLGRSRILALLAAFLGALLIIKPRFDLSILPALAGFLSAVLAGAAYTMIRFLSGKETPNTVIFYFSLISTLGVLPWALALWETPTPKEWGALLGTGIFAALGQYCLTRAYQRAPAGEISIYNYTHILFSGVLGFFLLGELPDLLSLIGGVLIAIVAAGLFLASRKGDKSADPGLAEKEGKDILKGMEVLPHRAFMRLVREGDPIKIQNRLMSASDKGLAMALTYLDQGDRLFVFSRLSLAKTERVKAVLARGAFLGRKEYVSAVNHLNQHLQADSPLPPLRSYYRPRGKEGL